VFAFARGVEMEEGVREALRVRVTVLETDLVGETLRLGVLEGVTLEVMLRVMDAEEVVDGVVEAVVVLEGVGVAVIAASEKIFT
jgi:hypothetical protein